MTEIISKHYKRSRLKSFFRFSAKKILQMGILVAIGEYMLLRVINMSLSEQQPVFPYYQNVPSQIVSMAVNEKPILRIARVYSDIKKNLEFDGIIEHQYPAHIKGRRPDFRALNLQDKEGAKVGYVVKF
ncbi:MAG TPA: hypothetical protein DCL35_00315 [Candidatus Omnitrophica bacterium]|nr:hypothetical protein [Candidatus Omnitrophota bacterium]